MKLIEDYILLPKTDRQSHLKLDEPCIERGVSKKGGVSTYCRGLLAHLHDTTIPVGSMIHVCHACHNSKCSNPNHLYWGTSRENKKDADSQVYETIWDRMVNKYGLEKAKELQKIKANRPITDETRQKLSLANKGRKLSEEHKRKISEGVTKQHRKL